MGHTHLVEQARRHLVRQGATNITVLDGARHKKPVPDLIAELDGKKVAVECGYLCGNKKRWQELRDAGYEVIIYFPYLECFDMSMKDICRIMYEKWLKHNGSVDIIEAEEIVG